MPWTGWKLPGSENALTGSYGSNGWSGLTAIEADDGSAATSTASSGGTQFINFWDFGFTTSDVPSGVIIKSVQLRIEHRKTNTGGVNWATFNTVLFTEATPTDTSNISKGVQLIGAGAWPTSYTVTDFGASGNNGTGDWFGGAITDAEVRSTRFGGQLAAGFTGVGGTGSAQVDYVACRVEYLLNEIDAKDAGTWKVPDPSAKHSNTWKTPVEVWAKDAGVWKQVYG